MTTELLGASRWNAAPSFILPSTNRIPTGYFANGSLMKAIIEEALAFTGFFIITQKDTNPQRIFTFSPSKHFAVLQTL